MSWQAYVDSSLVGTGTVDKAAIYSKAGDSTWAISSGFHLSGPEVITICEGFDNNDAVLGSGIKIGGQKYITIRADDKVIQGRKGEEGVICHRTKQAVLVAHYPAGQQAGEVTKVVLALGDYLSNLGY